MASTFSRTDRDTTRGGKRGVCMAGLEHPSQQVVRKKLNPNRQNMDFDRKKK